MAFALGFPSADHFLASITSTQWQEWKTWVRIRGPVGGPRTDFYTSLIAMYAGGPYEQKVTTKDFPMPWAPPQEDEDEGEG